MRRDMRSYQQRIDHERWLASKSTYGGCYCGLSHVPGCKVRVTERLLLVAVILLAVAGLCQL